MPAVNVGTQYKADRIDARIFLGLNVKAEPLTCMIPIASIEDFAFKQNDRLLLAGCLDVIDKRLEPRALLFEQGKDIGDGVELVLLGHDRASIMPRRAASTSER